MSLHDSASQLQSAGRGEDKVLVHMTPGEVSGLQSLAMAHGGSLTINPTTGLPEAGILSSLLPTLIGFGLAPLTGGLSAALITGAGYTAATGSLKKGIMAGLGAYGGAGLAGGLNSMGAAAGANAGTAGANAAKTAITNVADDAANFAGANSNAFSTNAAFNPSAGFQRSAVFNTPTPGMTSTNLIQARLPQYADVKFATGMPKPIPADPGLMPTSVAERHALVSDAVGGFNVPKVVPKHATLIDRMKQPFVSPIDKSSPYFTDISGKIRTLPPTSEVAQGVVPNYAPSTATTTQQFAGKLPSVAQPSNAVDLSGQTVSRPYTDYMSQVGRGAEKVYAGGVDGLGALADAMPKYSIAAGIGGPALSYAEEKREEAEEEMRKRQAAMNTGMIRPYEFSYGPTDTAFEPYSGSAERTYFQPSFTALKPYKAPGPEYKSAAGGLTSLAVGGQVEQMAAMNAVGANTGYPQANLQTPMYSNPAVQRPEATDVVAPSADVGVGAYTGEARFAGGGTAEPQTSGGYKYDYDPTTMQFTQTGAPTPKSPKGRTSFGNLISSALEQGLNKPKDTSSNGAVSGGVATPVMQPQSPAQPLVPNINIPAYQTPEQQLGLGGFYDYMNQQMGGYAGYAAGGGVSHLGDYSDGGRLLKGPGDGVSDSIPASIGNRQPARLADGEFVVPARIVSEIGNGSTEAGARKLYAMMDRVQKARRKTVGKKQVARNTKAEKLLPA